MTLSDLPWEVDAALAGIARQARKITAADGAAIAISGGGVVTCRARAGDAAPDLGAPLDSAASFTGLCLRTGSTLVCNDSENDATVDAEVCRQLGIRSIVASPVRRRGLVTGVVEVFSSL